MRFLDPARRIAFGCPAGLPGRDRKTGSREHQKRRSSEGSPHRSSSHLFSNSITHPPSIATLFPARRVASAHRDVLRAERRAQTNFYKTKSHRDRLNLLTEDKGGLKCEIES